MRIDNAFLRKCLEKAGLRQVELARAAGIASSRLSLILGGWEGVGTKTLKKLRRAMTALGFSKSEISAVVMNGAKPTRRGK